MTVRVCFAALSRAETMPSLLARFFGKRRRSIYEEKSLYYQHARPESSSGLVLVRRVLAVVSSSRNARVLGAPTYRELELGMIGMPEGVAARSMAAVG